MSAPGRAEQAENEADVDEGEALGGECLAAPGGQQESGDLAARAQHERGTADGDAQAPGRRRGLLDELDDGVGNTLPIKASEEPSPRQAGGRYPVLDRHRRQVDALVASA